MDLERITPLVLTYNEAPNIRRTLAGLCWAKKVVMLDSGSTDATREIGGSFENVEVRERAFDTHSAQWNYGLSLIETEWALTLDADYVLPEEVTDELRTVPASSDVAAYFAEFTYCVFGHPLRASLYPRRAVLFRPDSANYIQDGHTQRLVVHGAAAQLKTRILHDDRKSLSHWLAAQDKYARLEAANLLSKAAGELSVADRLRANTYLAAVAVAIYLLIGEGLILSGWRGWFYVAQRTTAELLLSLRLIIERYRLQPPESGRL